jgi:hypothetical protein
MKHVLQIMLDRLDEPIANSEDVLGIKGRTVLAYVLPSQCRTFTAKAQQTVAETTGVRLTDLETNSQDPKDAATGEPFSLQTWNAHQVHVGKTEKLTTADYIGHLQLLTLKVGQLLLAGAVSETTVSTALKIRSALNKIGELFPHFNNAGMPLKFYLGMGSRWRGNNPKGKPLKPDEIWNDTLPFFVECLREIEKMPVPRPKERLKPKPAPAKRKPRRK